MPQQLNLTNAGIYTAPNYLSAVPQGAMLTANNLVIDNNGVLASRRGLDNLASFPLSTDRASRYTSFQSQIIAAYSNQSLGYYNSGTWTAYSGTYSHPDANLARIRFLSAASNLYLTTSSGIQKLDTYNGTPTQAGMYPGLDLTVTTTGSSGFLSDGTNYLINGFTTNGSPNVQGVPNISGLAPGQFVTGTNISSNSTILSISGNTVVLSQNATGTNVKLQPNAAIVQNSIQMLGLTSTTNLAVGQYVSGSGIQVGTTVAAITGNNVTLSTAATQTNVILITTGNIASGTNSVSTLAATAGIAIGQLVTGAGIAANTSVSGISGTTVTLSQNATASSTGATITFFTPTQFTFYDNTQLTSYTGNAASYRMLWGIKDANNNIILGSPSGRAIVTNSAPNSVNTSIAFTIPAGITTAHFYQIYRSFSSGGSSIDPGDELQLVFEGNPSSSDIINEVITVTDLTPDSLLGEALYTNASQQSISQENTSPPLAWDMATFRNYTFYANTTSKQRLKLTMLAAGGGSGVQVGDVITIAGVSYTASTSEIPSSGIFQVFTSGTPAQNITATAESLVKVINQYSSTTFLYATYQSGVTDLPGIILLEERGIGGSSFAATVSAHGSAWSPALPTSGTSISSANDNYLNGLSFSKAGQPEAVPLANQYFVGSAANRILRILPLQNSLLILKEKEGVYRLTGYDPSSFVIDLLDSSARLLAPDSAVVLNNQIWCLTDQGISILSETGVSIVSRPIEDQLQTAYGNDLTGYKYFSSGISYETDRKFILLTVTNAADTYPTQAFCFNTFTNAFTIWPLSKACGFVNPVDNKLYMGDAVSAFTNIERKSYSYKDFVDAGVTYSLTSFSGTNVYLSSTNEIQAGDTLYQSDSVQSLILSVQPGYVTVQDNLTWTMGNATVYKAIDCVAEWVPVTVGNPGTMKQCPEISLLFKQYQFNNATLYFASDISQYYEPVSINGFRTGLWGLFPWASQPWGGTSLPQPIRTLIPREKQRCSQLRIRFELRQGFSQFQLLGMSIPIGDDQSYFIS